MEEILIIILILITSVYQNININYYNEVNQPKKSKENNNTTKTINNISDIDKSIEIKKNQ